jgi:Pentapeptide repeats (9 copies)/Pentapeptide repeats (8 copies)
VSRRRSFSQWLGISEQRWTTEPGEEVRPAKTGWDWLQLLIVPVALATIGYFLNTAQSARDRRQEDARAAQAQAIALDERRDQVLQDYLHRMDDLLLQDRLRESGARSEVRGVARTLTLTALRRVDGQRKGEVVRFLWESGLIGPGVPVVSLVAADLRDVELDHAELGGADLGGADLRRASLRGAGLDSVRFDTALLQDAVFSGATLAGDDFTGARLERASFRGVRMETAQDFRGEHRPVSFRGACLSGATFDGADLRSARLAAAGGVRVRFHRAQIVTATLQGARLADVVLDAAVADRLPAGWTLKGARLTPADKRAMCAAAARVS